MLKKALGFFVAILLVVLSGCQKTPEDNEKNLSFESMVVLGDSFSDNGNVYRLTRGQYPGNAYYQGRFSDGPVWSEYFASSVGINPHDDFHFQDFAYGQAQILAPYTIEITKDDGEKLSYSIPDLNEQITTYLKKPVAHAEKTLFVIFIGTNDLLNLGMDANIEPLLSVFQKQLQRLLFNGAKHILVVNMRNLTISPYECAAAENVSDHPDWSPDAYKKHYTDLITKYNQRLAEMLRGINEVHLFDAYAFDTSIHEKILAGGYDYQFQGKTYTLKFAGDGCYLDHAEQSCYFNKGNYQKKVSPICPDAQEYFFYDRVHPTTYVHKLMADAVYEDFKPQ